MANKIQIEERIQTILQLLSQGWGSGEVERFCAEKWGVQSRQSQVYLKRARERLMADWSCNRQDFLAEMMNRYQTVYRKSLKAQQYGAAIGALNAMAKLARVVD